ncbi:hypothetical protein BU14_1779s0002 [Porphyra umbilicalis]|uniref:Uncharacterized protein n=1 Tax=Porphyra umbilicalis TaxID=2786 RepID=A0A1X6NL23_PORUM|nr:hypothetical protein BU14_1779s0002 [Porphyra umbilicalis]|eukprot:OSX69166.1 hypothetical protein BU14_1779s0002 [Porphyra umbilicalis]
MRYTPATGRWDWRSAPPQGAGGIHHMQCVALGDYIYILAAFTGFFPQEPTVPRVLAYHPGRNEWSTGSSPIPAPHRRGAAAAVAYRGAIYVACGNIGGHGFPHSTSQRTFSRFTPPAGGGADGQWAALPAAPRVRDHVSAVVVGDEMVLAGGRDGGARSPFNAVVTEIDVYAFGSGAWRTLRSRLAVGRGAPVVGAIGGRVVIAGGEGKGEVWPQTEVLDVAADTIQTVAARMLPGPGGSQGRHATTGAVCNGVIYAAAGSGRQGGSPELSSMEAFSFVQPPPKCT